MKPIVSLSVMNYLRENILQEAGPKNQEFQSTSQSVTSFLQNLPQNTINPNDSLSQVTAKENSQKVKAALFTPMLLFI